MPFPEVLKARVRRRAHLACCLCKAMGVEVHHVIPEEEDGPETEDNAAPLCPSCHEIYGSNPLKRKFIREARDLWYEICERRYASDPARLDEIDRLLRNIETHVQTSTFPLLPFALFYTLRHTSTDEAIRRAFGKVSGYGTARANKYLKMVASVRLGGAGPYNSIDVEPEHSHCVLTGDMLTQIIERHGGFGEGAIKSPNDTIVEFFFAAAATSSTPSLTLRKVFPGDGRPREVRHLELFDDIIFQDALATGWEVTNPSKRAWSTADLLGARLRLTLKYMSYDDVNLRNPPRLHNLHMYFGSTTTQILFFGADQLLHPTVGDDQDPVFASMDFSAAGMTARQQQVQYELTLNEELLSKQLKQVA